MLDVRDFAATAALAVMLLGLGACGGGEDQPAPENASREVDPAAFAAQLDAGPRAAKVLRLDPALADRGAVLFDTYSCSDCHTLGESDLAPDLAGVLEKRTLPWLKMQITDPEWMNTHDPIAQALITEYGLEMADMQVSDADADALLHFLLQQSGSATPPE